MSWLDWLIVIVLNGGVVVSGLVAARGISRASDWFLAGKSLPFWLVGISMYATAIDSSDLIADSGGTYLLGIRYFAVNWVGCVLGWVLAAHFVLPQIYRAGMFTNAEYLEARFGPSARILSVFVQVQYRTLVLGIILTTLYLTLAVACKIPPGAAWAAVAVSAAAAAAYTAFGGLRSEAVADALQFVVMAGAAITFWIIIYDKAGGWSGIEGKLAAAGADLPEDLLRAGTDLVRREDVNARTGREIFSLLKLGGMMDATRGEIVRTTPAWMVAFGVTTVGVAYAVVNQEQAMRMLGSRSLWDLKMAAVAAGALMLVFSFLNLSVGIIGRALYPDSSQFEALTGIEDANQDVIYPLLVRGVETPVLKGLLVAGIFAAALSTIDSIGAAVSTLLTRDVYARVVVRDRDDRHYLRVGRLLTPLVIGGSFLYVPFLVERGMLFFYLEVTSAFVVPLLALYLAGSFTPVSRRSGLLGLLAGATYGVLRLLAPWIATATGVAVLPPVLMDPYGAYLWSLVISVGAMLLGSLVLGWERRGELLRPSESGWLLTSQERASRPAASSRPGATLVPLALGLLVVAAGAALSFVVFW